MAVSAEPQNPNEVPRKPALQAPFFVKFFATGFFFGYSPIAPGTAGSVVALIIYFIPSVERATILFSLILIFFLIGVITATKMEAICGHDPTIVVIDEIVGMWISLLLLPKTVWVVLSTFLLFRIFDIFKPEPALHFQKRNGGFAIMMDDVVCGVYTNLVVRGFLFIASKLFS